MSTAQLLQTAMKTQSALSSIGTSPFSEDGKSVKGEDTDGLVNHVKNSWLYAIALGGVASAVVCMLLSGSLLVDLASICLFGMAPYVVYQKIQLSKLGGMREQQNQLRANVNIFSEQNKKLSANVDNLESNVTELKDVEKDFEAITKTAGGQVDRLVNVIQENGEIQKKVKAHLEASVIQSILTAILNSDTDSDFSLSKKEMNRLKVRLSNIPGIVFDKENFSKFLAGRDLTMAELMGLIRNLKEDDAPENDNIFHIRPDKLK